MKIKLLAVAALASAFALTPLAKADSVSLISHTGDTYNYALTFDEHTTVFFLDGFQLSSLSGVTDAELTGPLSSSFGVVDFDANSVTVGSIFSIEYGRKIPFSVGTLTITSTDAPGNVDFSILDSNGLSTGQVEGPSNPSPVPEPSSLVLLGTGLLGVAGVVRRKLFA